MAISSPTDWREPPRGFPCAIGTAGDLIVDIMSIPRPEAHVSLGNELSKSDARRLVKQGAVRIVKPLLSSRRVATINDRITEGDIGSVIMWGKHSALVIVDAAGMERCRSALGSGLDIAAFFAAIDELMPRR